MLKEELLKQLDIIAPLCTQQDWDNSGMQIDLHKPEISRILVALEITYEVIQEATAKDADMIITHHPLLFHPIKRVDTEELCGDYLTLLIQNEIEVYSSHTPFDEATGGNNDYILKALGADSAEELRLKGEDTRLPAVSRIGRFDEPRDSLAFLKDAHRLFSSAGVVMGGTLPKQISSAAICTGAGGEYWQAALQAGADIFITGELKHHEAQAIKESGFCFIEAGHYGTEICFIENMSDRLQAACSDVQIIRSEADQNPYSILFQ